MSTQLQPDRNGWWYWYETGSSEPEKILLSSDGKMVAFDDEWEQATGQPVRENGFEYNYWEGTDTTQAMMPGEWEYIGPVNPNQLTP